MRPHHPQHAVFHDAGTSSVEWVSFALLVLLTLLVAITLVWWVLAAREKPAPPAPASGDDALTTLRQRYARGEIAREDFVAASADLGAPVPAATPGESSPAEPPPS